MPVGVFLVAERARLRSLAKELRSGPLDGTAEIDGMSVIDLVTLCQAANATADVDVLEAALPIGSGLGVVLPDPVRDRLSTLSDHELPAIASAWAASEEFQGLMAAEDLAAFLRSVRDVARASHTASRPLSFLNQ